MKNSVQKVTNDSGSNYCKMPDGTLIQQGTLTVSANANAIGHGYVTYPMAFSNTPVFLCSVIGYIATAGTLRYAFPLAIESSQTTIRYVNNGSSQANADVVWLAIGRWK